jgi:hypothetical protein
MVGRVLAFLVLFGLGLGGLAMSACGGFFLLGSLFGGGSGELAGIWVIAAGALGLGLLALWGVVRGFRALSRTGPSPGNPEGRA